MAQLAREAANDNFFRLYASGISSELIRNHFRYREEIEEIIRTPQFMLKDLLINDYLEGDCDDISTFYAAVFKVQGVPCRFVAIRYDAPEFQHVFVEARIDRPSSAPTPNWWQRFDATVPTGTIHKELERMVLDV